jgi:hypothetical protein
MENSNRTQDDSLAPGWHVPPGYSIGQAPNGHHYLVPTFMMDATDLALNTHSRKLSGAIKQAQGGVRPDVINALLLQSLASAIAGTIAGTIAGNCIATNAGLLNV